MRFVSRSSWGARHGRGSTSITPSRGGVTVHYVGAGKLTGQAHSKCAARVRSIESQHVVGNGWAGIAYTALVCEHGHVYEGRGLGRRTAANGTTSGNQNWYAVCALIGASDSPGDTLKGAIRDAIEWCRKSGGAASRVNGHRDHLSTSCPGDRLYAWVRQGAPRPGGSSPPAPSRPDYWKLTVNGETVTVPWATPFLREGMSGTRVRWLQESLNLFYFQSGGTDENGNPLLADRIYGHHTARGLFIKLGGKKDAT
jgi:hypothetical protein